MKEPAPLGDLVRDLLDRLGVADPTTWNTVQEEWERVAGEPWATQARPVSLRAGHLTVEAIAPPAVAVLRYGCASLVARLEAELGEGVVTEITVRPPARR